MTQSHAALPRWAQLAREQWTHTGTQRPPFAVEPGPGQESVWDYPRPPAIVATTASQTSARWRWR